MHILIYFKSMKSFVSQAKLRFSKIVKKLSCRLHKKIKFCRVDKSIYSMVHQVALFLKFSVLKVASIKFYNVHYKLY